MKPKPLNRCARATFVAVLVSGVLLRALTPAGYMPGSMADGTPFVLCPYATPGAEYFLNRGHGEHANQHHHGQGDADNSADRPWEFCPLGAAYAAAAPAYESAPAISIAGNDIPAPVQGKAFSAPPARVFWARGPPPFAS